MAPGTWEPSIDPGLAFKEGGQFLLTNEKREPASTLTSDSNVLTSARHHIFLADSDLNENP